jgi:hypothetical protein
MKHTYVPRVGEVTMKGGVLAVMTESYRACRIYVKVAECNGYRKRNWQQFIARLSLSFKWSSWSASDEGKLLCWYNITACKSASFRLVCSKHARSQPIYRRYIQRCLQLQTKVQQTPAVNNVFRLYRGNRSKSLRWERLCSSESAQTGIKFSDTVISNRKVWTGFR